MKKLFLSLLTLVSFSLFAQTQTITQVAGGNNDFKTLTAAIQAAGLVEALDADGPITVFAPTDAAFNALPANVLDNLLLPENKDKLAMILKYHVVPGKYTQEDVMAAFEGQGDDFDLEPLAGDEFEVEKKDGAVRLSDGMKRKANIVTTDIMASNGVIHVIDQVLLPKGIDVKGLSMKPKTLLGQAANAVENAAETTVDVAEDVVETTAGAVKDGAEFVADAFDNDNDADGPNRTTSRTQTGTNRSSSANQNNLVGVASRNGNFNTLTTAIEAAGYTDLLNSSTGFTVFAPTDGAFDKLPDGTVNSLVSNSDKSDLQDLLQYHVIPTRITAAQLTQAISDNSRNYLRLQTMSGKSLYAYTEGGNVYLVDGKGTKVMIEQTDVTADNGIIHVVSDVLMPYSTTKTMK